MFLATEDVEVSRNLFSLEDLPRPPDAPVEAYPPVQIPAVPAAPRQDAVDLLADWLVAYGAGQSVPRLADATVRSYLQPAKPARTRTNVFASLMADADPADGEIV